MKEKTKKIIRRMVWIITIFVFVIGLGSLFEGNIEIFNQAQQKDIYVDGANFSGLFQLAALSLSNVLGLFFFIGCILVDLFIWALYFIIDSIIEKINKKRR